MPDPEPVPLDLAFVLEALPDGVALVDSTAQFVWVNQKFRELTGWSSEEIVGRNGLDMLDPEQLDDAMMALTITKEASESLAPGAYRFLHRDGDWVTLELHGSPIDPRRADSLIAIIVRPIEYQAVMVDGIELLNAGGPVTDMASYIVNQVNKVGWTATEIAIILDDDVTGERRSISAGLLDELDGSRPCTDGPAPWEQAEHTGEPVHRELDDLPGSLREAAEKAGFVACTADIIPDPGGRPAVILLWFEAGAPPSYRFLFREEPRYLLLRLALERRHYLRALQRAAKEDHLTALANRAHFFETLERHPRTSRTAMLYIDLDDFKPINDTHGHAVGDALLATLGARLSSGVRPTDIVARLGGDEFAVFCTDVTDRQGVEALAERLHAAITAPIHLTVGGCDLQAHVGASLGVAIAEQPGVDPDHLLETADRQLYALKREHKGGWRVAIVS